MMGSEAELSRDHVMGILGSEAELSRDEWRSWKRTVEAKRHVAREKWRPPTRRPTVLETDSRWQADPDSLELWAQPMCPAWRCGAYRISSRPRRRNEFNQSPGRLGL
jgi:hypothetical protein